MRKGAIMAEEERSGAAFRELRRAIGVTRADVGAACSVREEDVEGWELGARGRPPKDAWRFLEEMDMKRKSLIGTFEWSLRRFPVTDDEKVLVEFTRYRSQDELDSVSRAGLGFRFVNSAICEMAHRASAMGAVVRFVGVGEGASAVYWSMSAEGGE